MNIRDLSLLVISIISFTMKGVQLTVTITAFQGISKFVSILVIFTISTISTNHYKKNTTYVVFLFYIL